MPYTDTWINTGDIFVTQKHGNQTALGTQLDPFDSVEGAMGIFNTTGNIIVAKSGHYITSTITKISSIVPILQAEGNVLLDGDGSSQIIQTYARYPYIFKGFIIRNYLNIGAVDLEGCQLYNNGDVLLVASRNNSFYNCQVTLEHRNNGGPTDISGLHRNNNYLNCTLDRTIGWCVFRFSFFDEQSSITGGGTGAPTFENCLFQPGFTIEGLPIQEAMDSAEHGFRFTDCHVISDPLFNHYAGNDPEKFDLTLQYRPERSPLYRGKGLYVGPHKFAVPITLDHPAFNSAAGSPSSIEDPVFDNLTIVDDASTGLKILRMDNDTPGSTASLRSSGRIGERLSFEKIKTVTEPVRISGQFYYPDEFIDTDIQVNQPSFKLRYYDEEQSQWMPNATGWYEMIVNSTWQVDANGKGNADPAFEVSTANFITCKEFQIEMVFNTVNP
ncbi:MAG TPA: hypothetical protein DCE41_25935 [Cytophagales bacterium]|nr:hypothetical protein [Cytophagales bacterium]HAA20271.1 hypothetical protein [Cytophagales bacterium]HAP58000.1 hypothetical protein [Cytophagales bacterium]